MSEVKVTVDTRQVKELAQVFETAAEVGMRRIAEQGTKYLRREVPKVTHNLEQGVTADVRVQPGKIEVDLIVSARTGRLGARTGTVHLASGKTHSVSLRPVPAFDYAEVVAKGKPAQLAPKGAGAFLIPVTNPQGTYIEADGQTYIVRRSIQAVAPNPYDERALERLQPDIDPILTGALKEFAGVQ